MNKSILKCNTTKSEYINSTDKIKFGPGLKESKPLQVKYSHIKN